MEEIVIRQTLKSFISELDNPNFVKVSRSAVINVKKIGSLSKYSRTSYKVTLQNNNEFKVSKTYLSDLKSLIA